MSTSEDPDDDEEASVSSFVRLLDTRRFLLLWECLLKLRPSREESSEELECDGEDEEREGEEEEEGASASLPE
jgi:hypothetical protein